MNHLNIQQNAFDRRETVVCPKPRRVGLLINNYASPLRCHEAELGESKKRADLLDMILMKERNGTRMASPPSPFFCGSPPSRSTNPLIHDAQFGDEKVTPFSPFPPSSPSGLSSPSSLTRKGGCARTKFGLTPATVRIEGFDCLNRDRHSSIPAVA